MSEVMNAIQALSDGAVERIAAQDARIDALTKAVDSNLADRNRRQFGGSSSQEQTAETKQFLQWARTGDGFERKANITIGTSTEGGVLVPRQLANELLSVQKNLSPMRKVARIYEAETSDFHIPISVGGTGAAWSAETGTRSVSNSPTFQEIVPPGGELYAVIQVSNWALQDSKYDLNAWLRDEAAAQFAVTENGTFITGDGSSKPSGLLAGTTAATADASRTWGVIEHLATGVSADFAATNKGDKLIELTYKLKPGYRANGAWMMPAAIAAEIRQFKSTTGQYLWQESVALGQPPMLLGYPVYECEDVAAKAANSLSVVFADFSRAYAVVDRVGLSVVRDEVTTRGHTLFYFAKRVYGKLVDSNAVKVLKFAVS